MVYSEKEQELEGRLLPTQELLAEAERLKSLAHRNELELGQEGITQKELSLLERARDQVQREYDRLEVAPAKPRPLERDMEDAVDRALRWRALLIHRAERLLFDDRPSRLKYRRGMPLYRLPERIYEELTWLLEAARLDLNRFKRERVLDEEFLDQGDDLRYVLHGLESPDREAMAKYQEELRNHTYGPPPKKPEPPPELPDVTDNGATLGSVRGHLYGRMRRVSAAGLAAFSSFEGREPAKYPALRDEFVLRVRPIEFDASLLKMSFADERKAAKVARHKGRLRVPDTEPESPAGAEVASAEPEPAREDKPRKKKRKKPKRVVNPGGAPPMSPDANLKPPPGAYGLVRPSATRGRKDED